MRRFVHIILLIMMLSCNKDGKPDELAKLKTMVAKIGQQLSALGFSVDVGRITIQLQEERDMIAMFNQISDESRQEVKTYTPFGPYHEEGDANSRLAFYDPNTKAIIFRKGASRALTNGYLVHELAHVYQDQKWSFDSIWKPYHNKPSRELFNIIQYIIEGHAELVRNAFEQEHATHVQASRLSILLGKISMNDCLSCENNVSPADLPYSLGMRFLLQQYRAGGWPLVERYFTELPASSEQIIHPKKFNHDAPIELSLSTWEDTELKPELVMNGCLGEAFLLSKLLSLNVPLAAAFQGASGWDGDIAHLYKIADGREALIWRIVFDRVVDAQQMENAVTHSDETDGIFRIGRIVDWIISDDLDLKKRLRIFLSKSPMVIEPDQGDEYSTAEQEITMKNDANVFYSPYYTPRVFIGPNL
jgi:hypothetical protein